MKTKKLSKDQIAFNLVGGPIVGLLALACLLPFILIVSGSFSSESAIIESGYSLLPKDFSLDAYKSILKDSKQIVYCYRNTIFYTVVGTGVGLFLTSMTAYVLSRKYYPWRNGLALFFYFTTLFSGGLVPTYLLTLSLGIKNTPWVMIIPTMLSVFNIIIMRSFISSVPDAIAESAKLDGANEFVIFSRVILPLCKPALATVGLFLALSYWNSWYNCMLYVSDSTLYSLQYQLYKLLNESAEITKLVEMGVHVNSDRMPPAETVKLAMTCITTGPILLLYPFVQRFFIKGITIGAVKG